MKGRRLTLRARLVALALAAALPLLLVGALDSYFWLEHQRQGVRQRQLMTAHLAAREIDNSLRGHERFLLALARVSAVRLGPPEARDLLFAELAQSYPQYHALFFLDPGGREQGSSAHVPDQPRLDAGHHSYFQAALARQTFTISAEPVPAGSNGRPVVPVLFPVVEDGRLVGFVGAELDVADLVETWSGLSLPEGAVLTLATRDEGVIVGQSTGAERAADARIPLPLRQQLAATEQSTFVMRSDDGGELLAATVPVLETPWSVIVTIPTAVAFAAWQQNFLRDLVLVSIALAGAVGLAILFGHRLSQPIAALRRGAAALRTGQRLRVEVHTGDELEELAEEFNAMAADLAEQQARLEERVAAATAAERAATAAAREEAGIARTLVETAQAMGSSLAIEEVFERILQLALVQLGADRCAIWLYDEEAGGYRARRVAGTSPPRPDLLTDTVVRPGDFPLVDALLQTHEPIAVDDVAQSRLLPEELVAGLALRSLLAVPIVSRGQPIGAILAAYTSQQRHLGERELALGAGLAAQAAAALANAQLYAELQEAKARMEAILEHAPISILFYDTSFRLTYANPTARQTFFPNQEEFLARRPTLDEIIEDRLAQGRHADDPEAVRARIAEVKQDPLRVHVATLHFENPTAYYLRLYAPVYSAGQWLGLAALYLDVTRQHQAIQIRDQFLTIVSHELRTPLTAVRGYAQLLLRQTEQADSIDPGRLIPGLRTIVEQTMRIDRLVEDLLDVSRLELERFELQLRSLDLAELVQTTVEALRPTVPHHDLLVRREVDGPLWVEGDADRLAQVLGNLIGNAATHAPEGTPIEVTLHRLDGAAEVAVRDQGVGIPPDELPRLFEPFFRGRSARNRRTGLGLGLYISSQIVRRHGGELTAESTPGVGSVFCVRLPLAGAGRRRREAGA